MHQKIHLNLLVYIEMASLPIETERVHRAYLKHYLGVISRSSHYIFAKNLETNSSLMTDTS